MNVGSGEMSAKKARRILSSVAQPEEEASWRTVVPTALLDLSAGWNLRSDRSPRPLSFSSFLLEDSGRVGDRCFDFDQIFRYARAEDVKRLEVFEEFVTKRDETGKQGRNRNRWTHLCRN